MTDIHAIFFYTRTDETYLEELERHLASLRQRNFITDWQKRDIRVKRGRAKKTSGDIDTANLFLLLISVDFMASDYVYSKEMDQMMSRHEQGKGRVVPIILRPAYWHSSPLGKLQALPTGGKPLTEWADRDSAYFDIAQGVLKVAEELKAIPLVAREPAEQPQGQYNQDNKRLAELENTIRSLYSAIRGSENIHLIFTHPQEKEQAWQTIDKQSAILKDFLDEYKDLARNVLATVPTDIVQIIASSSDQPARTSKINNSVVRDVLNSFTITELRLLGLNLNVDIDDFPGQDVASKINPLIDYMRQNARMDDLISYLRRRDPSVKLTS